MSLAFILLFNLLTINRSVDLKYCDIKGNVKNPGVYLVDDGDVINDIILKAGGLKKNSYVKNINLSKKVTDEMVISIMTIDEYKDLTKECPVCICNYPVCEENSTSVITTQAGKENVLLETTTTQSLTTNTTIPTTVASTIVTTNETIELININSATIEELVKLPGIGEATANKIIDYRETKKFELIEDILNVRGIGNVLFEKIKVFITV